MFTRTPNNAWLYVKADGEILNRHYPWKVGLGEVCSHVVAIMFYLLLT